VFSCRAAAETNGYEKTNSQGRATAAEKYPAGDIAPENGCAMVVDGHFKTQFSEKSLATKTATELLSRYPMLQVEIYDAKAKTRTRVEQGKAVRAE
jgi:hypothetical protein